jgi:N-acetylmuramoyl-L-alanine amidase
MKLAIDAGHGMGNRTDSYDPGAVYKGHEEASVALQYALAIKYIFNQAGIEVFLTRDDASDFTPVGKRDDKAKAAGCTHFISLHLNAGGGTGTETFYRDSQDKIFASKVQSVALQSFGLKNRGLKSESQSQHKRLAVLDFNGPACLVDLGFIDSDMEVLGTREARIAFASGLLELWKSLLK